MEHLCPACNQPYDGIFCKACTTDDKQMKEAQTVEPNQQEKLATAYLVDLVSNRKIPVSVPRCKVGRDDLNDIVITGDHSISRFHFILSKEDGRYYVMDNKSRHGTFLNGNQITGVETVNDGDVLKVGVSLFWFVIEVPQEAESSVEELPFDDSDRPKGLPYLSAKDMPGQGSLRMSRPTQGRRIPDPTLTATSDNIPAITPDAALAASLGMKPPAASSKFETSQANPDARGALDSNEFNHSPAAAEETAKSFLAAGNFPEQASEPAPSYTPEEPEPIQKTYQESPAAPVYPLADIQTASIGEAESPAFLAIPTNIEESTHSAIQETMPSSHSEAVSAYAYGSAAAPTASQDYSIEAGGEEESAPFQQHVASVEAIEPTAPEPAYAEHPSNGTIERFANILESATAPSATAGFPRAESVAGFAGEKGQGAPIYAASVAPVTDSVPEPVPLPVSMDVPLPASIPSPMPLREAIPPVPTAVPTGISAGVASTLSADQPVDLSVDHDAGNGNRESAELPKAMPVQSQQPKVTSNWCEKYLTEDLGRWSHELETLKEQIRVAQERIGEIESRTMYLRQLRNALLGAQGEELVLACTKVLGFMGWNVSADAKQELRLEAPNQFAIARVVCSGNQAERAHLGELSITQTRYWCERGAEPKGVLIISRLGDPADPSLSSPEYDGELAEYARKKNVCLLTTQQLLAIFRDIAISNLNHEAVRQTIVQTSGWLPGFSLIPKDELSHGAEGQVGSLISA
jgi:pSer/pThr/pTyr-binding forkhead associated (FHA) protein